MDSTGTEILFAKLVDKEQEKKDALAKVKENKESVRELEKRREEK